MSDLFTGQDPFADRPTDPFADTPAPPDPPKVYPPQQLTWCAAVGTDTCGCCGHRFDQGEAKALVTSRRLERCRSCAVQLGPDVQVDEAAIASHRAEILARQEELNALKQTEAPTQEEIQQRIDAQKTPRRPLGFSRVRDVAGARSMFDPRAAAANDRD